MYFLRFSLCFDLLATPIESVRFTFLDKTLPNIVITSIFSSTFYRFLYIINKFICHEAHSFPLQIELFYDAMKRSNAEGNITSFLKKLKYVFI